MSALIAANLVLRFLLELAALFAAGFWGFSRFGDWPMKLLCGIGVPVLMAAAWGIFRVPGDGGPPLVVTPPQARLLLEVVFFGLAIWLLREAGQPTASNLLLVLVLINYAISWERTWAFLMGRGA